MKDALILSICMSILGAISSLIGGTLGSICSIKSKKIVSFLYEITAGVMTGIVCFEMLPESLGMANIIYSVLGICVGVLLIYILDLFIQKLNNKKSQNNSKIIALVVMLSMAIHNAIEGLAIGSSFVFSISLGTAVLLGMFLHDIPEGMVVGITSKIEGKHTKRIIFETSIVGACVGIGTFIGGYIGKINETYIAISLSIAAGAMLYLVACELIPESKKNSKEKKIYLAYIIGIIMGALLSKI